MRLDEDVVRGNVGRRLGAMGAPARGTRATAMVNANAGLVARLWPRPIAVRHALTPRRPTDTAAVADAAEMLRGFNAPGGIAHTSADSVAERTKAAATTLTPGEAVTRFTE